MDLESAISESLLLDRCRAEQGGGIYRASDGRRVYFLWGVFGRGCVVEDLEAFALLQSNHQRSKQLVGYVFLVLNFAWSIVYTQLPRFPNGNLYATGGMIACAAWLVINVIVSFLHLRFLYRRLPVLQVGMLPWRDRIAQRRAVKNGELPAPLRR